MSSRRWPVVARHGTRLARVSDSGCVFCQIAAGELPARIVYNDDAIVAILDRAPATPGHTLVIPRAHYRDLWEMSDDGLAAVIVVARMVAEAIRSTLEPPGMWLHQVSGHAAGQDVFHYHLHLIPRYEDDTIQPGWGSPPWQPPSLTEEVQDRIAARIREAVT
jgi:histidine triad (HIT) family protein